MPSLLCPDGLQKEKKSPTKKQYRYFIRLPRAGVEPLPTILDSILKITPLQKKYTKHLVWLKTDPGEYSARADTFFRLTTGHL